MLCPNPLPVNPPEPTAKGGPDYGRFIDGVRKLQDHVRKAKQRVLVVAESAGRRESLLELLRDNRIDPPSAAGLAEFQASNEPFAIAVAPMADATSMLPRASRSFGFFTAFTRLSFTSSMPSSAMPLESG